MGIVYLENYFDVKVLDCTAWLMPLAIVTRKSSTANLPIVYSIDSMSTFKLFLNEFSVQFAIDYIGQFSLSAVFLFDHLKKKGVKLIVMDSGAYPSPTVKQGIRFSKSVFFNIFKNGHIKRKLNALLIRIMLKVIPNQLPDVALVVGTSWLSNPRFTLASRKILAHSFDYEKYLQLRVQPPSREFDYAVYIDENISGHEDNVETGYCAPVSEYVFFSALQKYFEKFETLSNVPILVAGYPSELRTVLFGNRKLIIGETAELIRNAKIVFAHASTAISFAVLWRRPIVFLSSNEMAQSWYQPWIEAPCKLLQSTLVNIDSMTPSECDIVKLETIDEDAYRQYEETYIKSKGSPEISLWSIFRCVDSDTETTNQS
jgi:hypothetical protein